MATQNQHMASISSRNLVDAVLRVERMTLQGRERLADEVHSRQPNLLYAVLVLQRCGATLVQIEVVLNLLFVFHEAMVRPGGRAVRHPAAHGRQIRQGAVRPAWSLRLTGSQPERSSAPHVRYTSPSTVVRNGDTGCTASNSQQRPRLTATLPLPVCGLLGQRPLGSTQTERPVLEATRLELVGGLGSRPQGFRLRRLER